MTRRGTGAAAAFAALLIVGTWLDRDASAPRPAGILVADLHVHPFPGDGVLTVGQLQREARRRGIDVLAITGHNNRVALDLAARTGGRADEPIVLDSQELTAPGFHMIAVGVRQMIDWRLPVTEAVRAIHAQGGAAIAAHPVPLTWKPLDEPSLRALDGVEVAHPMARGTGSSRRHLDAFFTRVRRVNPGVAPVGSTDFHAAAPLGLCRTYLLTHDRSAAGAVDAIRQGRTVAQDQQGRLYGTAEYVAEVRQRLPLLLRSAAASFAARLAALTALIALAVLSLGPRQQPRAH